MAAHRRRPQVVAVSTRASPGSAAASGSRSQFVQTHDLRRCAGRLRAAQHDPFFDGFLGARITPIVSLAFHPTRLLLGVGSTDTSVTLYRGP